MQFESIPFRFLPLKFFVLPSDYIILENNSLLRATLKYKRIQRTHFEMVPVESFGENHRLVILVS